MLSRAMYQIASPRQSPGTKKVDLEVTPPEQPVFEGGIGAKYVLPAIRTLFQHNPISGQPKLTMFVCRLTSDVRI